MKINKQIFVCLDSLNYLCYTLADQPRKIQLKTIIMKDITDVLIFHFVKFCKYELVKKSDNHLQFTNDYAYVTFHRDEQMVFIKKINIEINNFVIWHLDITGYTNEMVIDLIRIIDHNEKIINSGQTRIGATQNSIEPIKEKSIYGTTKYNYLNNLNVKR